MACLRMTLFVALLLPVLLPWRSAVAADYDYGIMPITTNTLSQWQADQAATPDYELPIGYTGTPRNVNLLTNVVYDARIRDQGHTGSCWMWGCQAALWLEYARQFPAEALVMTNGFSLQFISSYLHVVDGGLNEGGTAPEFKRFFDAFGYAISWDNTNAAWTDGRGYVATRPEQIYTRPNQPIHSLSLADLKTAELSTNDAINLLKSVLDAGHAPYFNLTLADGDEWDKFMTFWGKTNDNEETIFTNFVSGKLLSLETGGAHMMACVGYNDTDPDPSKHYWLILNSWSTGDNSSDTRRPHGTWRLPMRMNYGAYTVSGPEQEIHSPMFEWGLLTAVFTNLIQKGALSIAANLQAGNPDASSITIQAPITALGIISNIIDMTVYVNERYYRLSPLEGVWRQGTLREGAPPPGFVFDYASNPGVTPSLTAQVNGQNKTWSCVISNLTADDCRFVNPYRGLHFNAQYAPSAVGQMVSFCGSRAFAYDELSQLTMDSGSCSGYKKDAALTFISPTSGTVLVRGSTCIIEWTQESLEGKLLKLEVQDLAGNPTLAEMIPVEDGRWAWTVPYDIQCATNFMLKASAGEGYSFNGPLLTIVPSTNPALIVRAPAGGELWPTGMTRVVSWEGYHLSGNVTVDLLQAGSVVPGSAATAAASAGRLNYALPDGLSEGSYALRFSGSGFSMTSAAFSVTFTPRTQKPWTFLIYLDADNNLEADQMRDFVNIAKVGSTSNMNVLVQLDRIPGYYTGYDNWYGAKRYYMTNGIRQTLAQAAQDLGEVSIERPETLTDFINWGVENYPAERYFLVMCDHGDAWQGALEDFTPDNREAPLPMRGFAQALTNAVTHMTLVGYDCCVMAQAESAYQLRHCGAELYIGSQYQETMGWAYEGILRELEAAGGQMSPRALATRVCELSVGVYGPENPATQTAVDLAQLNAFAGAVEGWAGAMMTNTEDRARVRETADIVATNYYQAIVHHAANKQTEQFTSGLNIYCPYGATYPVSPNYLGSGLDFGTDARWNAFLTTFTNSLQNTWIGEARALCDESTDVDVMRFVNAIHPPDDSVWVKFSIVGGGSIDNIQVNKNLRLRKGDSMLAVARGQTSSPTNHFVRWWASDGATFSNALDAASNTVTVTANASVIAYFAEDKSEYTVTFTAIGDGALNGQRESFDLTVHHGSNAPAVSAVADAGSFFSGWSGDATGSANPLVISNVVSDMSILGLFWETPDAWSNHADTNWWQAGPTNFTLTTAPQLAGLAQLVNNGTDAFSNKVVLLGTNVNLAGKEWTAIGTSLRPYAGSFNGQGFQINGLTINRSTDDDYQGLFGFVHAPGSMVFENIHLTNTAIVAGALVGGIAGAAKTETGSILVRNCSNDGSVWGYGNLVGGLAGELSTDEDTGGSITVSNGQNFSEVRGAADTAGIAGRILARGTVILRASANAGGITGAGGEIGGLVGSALSLSDAVTIEGCLNNANLTADADAVGGIAGKMSGGDVTLNGCQNHGDITATGAGHQYAGGLVGHLGGMIPVARNCFNTGNVFGNVIVGGVAGLSAVSMQNSSNEGRVEGDDAVGGVVGTVMGETAGLQNCHNAGAVISTGRVGGVAGRIASGHGAAAESVYFLKTATTNAALPFVGEMVPTTNLTHCATFSGMEGTLSTNGYGNKTILANALNEWVSEQSGAYYWSTNRDGTPSYPYPDSSLTNVVVTFFANGGIFIGGGTTAEAVYELGRHYSVFPSNPARTNQAFVGWWYRPEPGADPAKLIVDLTAVPAVTWVDAWWSTTVHTSTPFPISVEKLAEYYPEVATMTGEQINALANGVAANGRDKVWELVFLGLNPADPAANPSVVFVYMDSNPFRVHTVPEAPIAGASAYTVQGKELLTDEVWTDLGAPGQVLPDNYRFLRVRGQ